MEIRGLPKPPLVLLIAFVVWDFTLPSFGPLEPHLLLTPVTHATPPPKPTTPQVRDLPTDFAEALIAVGDDLRTVERDTLQPSNVSLWLRR